MKEALMAFDTEHEVIYQFLAPKKVSDRVRCGVGDDAAVLYASDHQRVYSVDCLVEGTHFLSGASAEDIAYKAYAVAISDLAAMGARPESVMVSLTTPSIDQAWIEAFAKGSEAARLEYQVDLIGGNLSKGPLAVHCCVHGSIPSDTAPLCQTGMQVGDDCYLTKPLGGAAYALEEMKKARVSVQLHEVFWRPKAQVAWGVALRGIATSCVDVSDGLYIDLHRLCIKNHCGLRLSLKDIPIHPSIPSSKDLMKYALYGGEDYPLFFTAPRGYRQLLLSLAKRNQWSLFRVGYITEKEGIDIVDANEYDIDAHLNMWEHFNEN